MQLTLSPFMEPFKVNSLISSLFFGKLLSSIHVVHAAPPLLRSLDKREVRLYVGEPMSSSTFGVKINPLKFPKETHIRCRGCVHSQ